MHNTFHWAIAAGRKLTLRFGWVIASYIVVKFLLNCGSPGQREMNDLSCSVNVYNTK